MTEPRPRKKLLSEDDPRLRPIPGSSIEGRPEVSKGIFGDFFWRRRKKSGRDVRSS